MQRAGNTGDEILSEATRNNAGVAENKNKSVTKTMSSNNLNKASLQTSAVDKHIRADSAEFEGLHRAHSFQQKENLLSDKQRVPSQHQLEEKHKTP